MKEKQMNRFSGAMSRRTFLQGSAAAAAGIAAGSLFSGAEAAAPAGSPFTLPELPYDENGLAPVISARTLQFHYGKHHRGYMKKLNAFIKGTEYEGMNLARIIKVSSKKPGDTAVFNNAAQFWNHTFYWKSMSPSGGGAPPEMLAAKMKDCFGSVKECMAAFAKAAGTQFGSGWAWLVLDGGSLKVVKTSNADTPLAHGLKPLLTIDVWEHAYYLDYQNRRADYIKAVLEKRINWKFAYANMK